MDEGYRKALKLELSQFAMPFDLASTNILQRIQRDLFTSNTALHRFIRAEPYKLNIYGQLVHSNISPIVSEITFHRQRLLLQSP